MLDSDRLKKFATSAWSCLSIFCCVTVLSSASRMAVADSWTGIYAGTMAAVSHNVITGSTTRGDGGFGVNASSESANVDDRAAGFGAFLGARRQLELGGVAGVELSLSRLWHESDNFILINNTPNPSASLRYQTHWLATALTSIGLSSENFLVCITGGAAIVRDQARRTQYQLVGGASQAMFTEKDEAIRFGYALGALAEWRIAEGPWSLRVEYLHVRFPERGSRFDDARAGAQAGFDTVQGRIADDNGYLNQARIGFAYSF